MKRHNLWKKLMVGLLCGVLLLAGCGGGGSQSSVPSSGGESGSSTGSESGNQKSGSERISIRWNTAEVGSYGYSVASMMSDYLNRELGNKLDGNYVVTVHPFTSTTAAMKSTMDGEGEISYTADVGMTELYARAGAYEGWNPGKGELVHSFYAYPMETFLAVHKSRADDFSSWADFSGQPVFFSPAGFMNWLNMVRIFDALGYEFNHVEIDSGMVADALNDGSIVGSVAYTTSGISLPTFWKEAEMRTDIQIINPTDEEKLRLMDAGLTPALVDPKAAFSVDVGVDEIWGVPILFGYNLRADIPAEFVKAMLEIFEENAEELVKLDRGFAPLANDFVGLQVAGIKANPHIPVHPGLAEFLQERKAWDDSWTIAE